MQNAESEQERVAKRLDTVIGLLEDTFILQALKAGMDSTSVRELTGLRRERVSRISTHLHE